MRRIQEERFKQSWSGKCLCILFFFFLVKISSFVEFSVVFAFLTIFFGLSDARMEFFSSYMRITDSNFLIFPWVVFIVNSMIEDALHVGSKSSSIIVSSSSECGDQLSFSQNPKNARTSHIGSELAVQEDAKESFPSSKSPDVLSSEIVPSSNGSESVLASFSFFFISYWSPTYCYISYRKLNVRD